MIALSVPNDPKTGSRLVVQVIIIIPNKKQTEEQKAMIDGKLDDTEIKISHEIVERCKAVVLKDKDKNNNNEIEDLKKQMNT